MRPLCLMAALTVGCAPLETQRATDRDTTQGPPTATPPVSTTGVLPPKPRVTLENGQVMLDPYGVVPLSAVAILDEPALAPSEVQQVRMVLTPLSGPWRAL